MNWNTDASIELQSRLEPQLPLVEATNTTNLIVFQDSKSHELFFPFSLLASLAMTTTVPFLLSPRVLEMEPRSPTLHSVQCYVVGRIYKIIGHFESIAVCGL